MYEMRKQIQLIINEIDRCIEQRCNEALTLSTLSKKLNYSEFYITKKFKEISGMTFRDYLRRRKLAFALKEIRDGKRGILAGYPRANTAKIPRPLFSVQS